AQFSTYAAGKCPADPLADRLRADDDAAHNTQVIVDVIPFDVIARGDEDAFRHGVLLQSLSEKVSGTLDSAGCTKSKVPDRNGACSRSRSEEHTSELQSR